MKTTALEAVDLNFNGQMDKSEQEELQKAIRACIDGIPLSRVMAKSVGCSNSVYLSSDKAELKYIGQRRDCSGFYMRTCQKQVDMSEILEVRPGWNSDNFHKQTKRGNFAITHPEEAKSWILAVDCLIRVRREQRNYFDENEWLAQMYDRADANQDGMLTFEELWNLLQQLEVEATRDYVAIMFQTVLGNHSSSNTADEGLLCYPAVRHKLGEAALDKEGFVAFFNLLTYRKPLEAIMKKYAQDWTPARNPLLNAEALRMFLVKDQDFSQVTVKDAADLIERFEPEAKNKQQQLMAINGFRRLLLSNDWGNIMLESRRNQNQPMNRPMCEYFVCASHNTYLTGGQLVGEASVEGYLNALKLGARMVELDVYDGPSGDPVLYHGNTLVRPLPLTDACRAINNAAFKDSPFPLFLSVENHCKPVQQRRMAEIFKEIFKQRLYCHDEKLKELTPEALKGRIIVKAAMLSHSHSGDEEDESDSVRTASPPSSSANITTITVGDFPTPVHSNNIIPRKDSKPQIADEEIDQLRKHKVTAEFSAIVGVPVAHQKHLKDALQENESDTMLSLSEPKVQDYFTNRLQEIMKYCV